MRVGHDLLLDLVTSIAASIDQPESWHTVRHPVNLRVGVAFLFGEKVRSVRDDHPHVADAGVINARVIYLVEDTVA